MAHTIVNNFINFSPLDKLIGYWPSRKWIYSIFLIIFSLKILDVTNRVFYHFLSTPDALKRFWDVIPAFKQLQEYIWIVLTQVLTESILVLKSQRKTPEVPFVSLLNSSVTRSRWIAETTYPVKRKPNPLPFSSLSYSPSSFLKDCKFTRWNAP